MYVVPAPNLPDEQKLVPTGEVSGITNIRANYSEQFVTIFAEAGQSRYYDSATYQFSHPFDAHLT
jgi:hypothetical protein